MRVLIAHANEKTRSKLADVVTRGRRLSLDILTCGEGAETLDVLLGDDPPEVALIDWDLPGIEAPEMCRLVRDFHHHHDTWIIVLAARAHQETASEVWKAGADDCVYTPAPAKLLSDRVTKGLCEMAPPIRAAAAAAAAAAEAARQAEAAAAAEAARKLREAARPALAAVAPAAADSLPEVVADAAPEPSAFGRPTLDAVRRADDQSFVAESSSLTADLRATVGGDDALGSVDLAAAPVRLEASAIDPDEIGDAPSGQVTLDAVLARL